MKSSKDIPPRVGMQVRCGNRLVESVSMVSGSRIFFSVDGSESGWCRGPGSGMMWDDGDIEILWIPPTDDERRLFMERCTHPDGFGHIGRFDSMKWVFDGHPADCPYCNRNWREIAESLALDGADYDNMPDFEELER